MSSAMHRLYSETIRDHGNQPRHGDLITNYQHLVEASNPLCGDQVVLCSAGSEHLVKYSGRGTGCILCRATTSLILVWMNEHSAPHNLNVLLTLEGTLNRSVQSAHADQKPTVLDATFGSSENHVLDGIAGDLASLQVVLEFPTRRNCVLVPIQAMIRLAGRTLNYKLPTSK